MNLAKGFLAGEIKGRSGMPAAKVTSKKSVDPLVIGFVIVDIGVVGAGLAFWWKRRRSRVR